MATFDELVPLVEESQELLLRFDPGEEQDAFGSEPMRLVMITVGQPETSDELDKRVAALKALITRMRDQLQGRLN